jgi:hypothetical protein
MLIKPDKVMTAFSEENVYNDFMFSMYMCLKGFIACLEEGLCSRQFYKSIGNMEAPSLFVLPGKLLTDHLFSQLFLEPNFFVVCGYTFYNSSIPYIYFEICNFR